MNNHSQDTENDENINPSNYCYGSYFNYKAFNDFHLIKGIDDSYLTPGHCMLLAFMVEKFYKDRKMPMIEKNGIRYVLMNTNFIKDNLIYLNVKERTIKNYISKFKRHGLMKIEVKDKSNRYVNINDELVNLCYEKYGIWKPINYLMEYRPEWWKGFVNEWRPYFIDEDSFKLFVDNFNDTRDIEQLSYNTKEIYDHLLKSVNYKIYGSGSKVGLKAI
ncbi:MAG: hypothetical protein KDC90_07440 [Ignavibacteriae bacterium]|nr:hypothetical protein [Ignavibacteriota bacterium]